MVVTHRADVAQDPFFDPVQPANPDELVDTLRPQFRIMDDLLSACGTSGLNSSCFGRTHGDPFDED